jgi:hypothetical protein
VTSGTLEAVDRSLTLPPFRFGVVCQKVVMTHHLEHLEIIESEHA